MKIVSIGDNLHVMSKPVFLENKDNTMSLLSAEIDIKVVKVNMEDKFTFLHTNPLLKGGPL